MSKIKISVGASIEQIQNTASDRFIDAWHRAEAGQRFEESYLSFENWETLARVLSSKRIELLRYVHGQPTPSIRVLAKALNRDYRNVHSDVHALMAAGLLDTTAAGIRANYDRIETTIAL